MTNFQQYVSMLAFSEDAKYVVLLVKNKPDFLAGKLCPVGGRIEIGESILYAVVREFFEETGVKTDPNDWRPFATVTSKVSTLYCNVMFSDKMRACLTMEEEPVFILSVAEVLAEASSSDSKYASDLIALIGLALQCRTGDKYFNLGCKD